MVNQGRKAKSSTNKVHAYWYKQVTGKNAAYWVEKLGDSSYENIVEGGGEWCYACGKESKHHQHCHIVPHALGGSNEPENIFLMCGRCHQDNPDTIFTDLFFDYVKTKNFWLDEIAIETSKVFMKLVKNNPELGDKVVEQMLKDDFDIRSFLETTDLSESIGVGCNNRMSYTTMAGSVYHILAKNVEQESLPT